MNDCKNGDEIYFFYTNSGRNDWGEDDTIINPSQTELLKGIIVKIDEDKDYVHLYVDGCTSILEMGWTFFDEHVFKSKKYAVEAMIKRMEGLRDE